MNNMFVKLKDIADLTVGYVGNMTKEYIETGVPFFRSLNIKPFYIDKSDLLYISSEFNEKIKKSKLMTGDLVIVRTGQPGTCCVVPQEFDGCNCSDLVIVRPDKKLVNPYYLEAYINFMTQKQITNHQVGAIQKHFNVGSAKEMLVYLPDREKQEKIANLVRRINSKIELNNKINTELESIAKTLYDYWFLQFEFPNEEGKPYKSSGGKMVWNEELKMMVQVGWVVDTLEKHIKLIKGISYTSKNIETKTGIPMINLASIDINRNYKPNELKYYAGVYNSQKEVFFGDMLIACTDLTRNANIIGSPVLVPNDKEKYVYSMDLAKIEVVDNKFNPLYLYMTLRTDFYHNYIKGFASGTNVLHLNTDGISWFKTYIPLKKIQDKFGTMIEEFHAKKCQIIKENQELIDLRDFLIPLLINGQVGFKD